jgi:hypothetical protein
MFKFWSLEVIYQLNSSYIMAILIVILTFIASAGGLSIESLYKDSENFILNAWYGNDQVTLFVALPLLIFAVILSKRGSVWAHLVWLGMLNYILYNYAFYLFGAALNAFFLIYVVLFSLSIISIIYLMVNLERIKISFRERTPVKAISIYMFLLALILGFAWIGQWLSFVFTGEFPQIMINTKSVNYLVAALDLTFVVPVFILAAIYLWRRKGLGFILAVMVNVKGFVYNLVLIVGSIVQEESGIEGALDLVPLWILLSLGCLVSSLILLLNLKPMKIR